MDKIIRKQPAKFNNVQTTIAPKTKLCFEGTWEDRKIVLYKGWTKDCLSLPEWGWTWLDCTTLSACPVIVQIQGDINTIEWDIVDINTIITNLQNATTVEAIQDIVAPMLVHGNHSWLTATYDDVNNQIILTVTWGGGSFTCADVATCIDSSIDTQTSLLNWLQWLTNVTLAWNWNFEGDVSFTNNTVTFDNSTVSLENNTAVNYDSTVISNHNGDTINYDWSTINSDNTTYNYDNDTINYGTNTIVSWWTFNNITITWSTISPSPLKSITQISHWFVLLDWIRYDEITSTWVKAQSDNINWLWSRHVISVIDLDTFLVWKDWTYNISNSLTEWEYVLSDSIAWWYTQTLPTNPSSYILYWMEVIDSNTINFYSVVWVSVSVISWSRYATRTSKSVNTIYQATSAWWMLVVFETWGDLAANTSIFSDSNPTPTTLVWWFQHNDNTAVRVTATVPILPNHYYTVTTAETDCSIFFYE